MTVRLGMADAFKALLRHPRLLGESVRVVLAMRRRDRLQLSSHYLRWRIHTAYGAEEEGFTAQDLVHYLRWRKEMRSMARWGRAL